MPELHNDDVSRMRELAIEPPAREDGVYLDDLAEGAVVEIETQHHNYTLVKHGGSHASVSGHPAASWEPIQMEMEGSIGSGSLSIPNPNFIGPGMYLVLKHPVFDRITTSRIREIHKFG